MEGIVRIVMNWNHLTDLAQLEKIKAESTLHPVVIFKHSTRCSISRMVLDRLERSWNQTEVAASKPYFLDLLSYRQISNQIADIYCVEHESPQVLIIKNGQSIFDRSHMAIDFNSIKEAVKSELKIKNNSLL